MSFESERSKKISAGRPPLNNKLDLPNNIWSVNQFLKILKNQFQRKWDVNFISRLLQIQIFIEIFLIFEKIRFENW